MCGSKYRRELGMVLPCLEFKNNGEPRQVLLGCGHINLGNMSKNGEFDKLFIIGSSDNLIFSRYGLGRVRFMKWVSGHVSYVANYDYCSIDVLKWLCTGEKFVEIYVSTVGSYMQSGDDCCVIYAIRDTMRTWASAKCLNNTNETHKLIYDDEFICLSCSIANFKDRKEVEKALNMANVSGIPITFE